MFGVKEEDVKYVVLKEIEKNNLELNKIVNASVEKRITALTKDLFSDVTSTLLAVNSVFQKAQAAYEAIDKKAEQQDLQIANVKNEATQMLAYAKKIVEAIEKGETSRMQVLSTIADKLSKSVQESANGTAVGDALIKISKCLEEQTQNQAQIVGQLKSVVEYIQSEDEAEVADTNPFDETVFAGRMTARRTKKTKNKRR